MGSTRFSIRASYRPTLQWQLNITIQISMFMFTILHHLQVKFDNMSECSMISHVGNNNTPLIV